ncbi:MAG: hypothetical protein HY814_06045, partial [Candidatus Riflebacteria bacterium]|nr:hypothetical protein [Candidatus Riflebacteria bacterium]
VQGVSGEVETSTSTTGWEALKTGAVVGSGVTVRTGKNGKVTLLPSVSESRIVLYENTQLVFEKVQLSKNDPESAAFSFDLEKGEAVFDFPKGVPICRVAVPMVTLWSQLVRYKVRIDKDDNRILVSRFAIQAEDRADPSRKVIVGTEQELIATLKDPVAKPRSALGAAMRDRWD